MPSLDTSKARFGRSQKAHRKLDNETLQNTFALPDHDQSILKLVPVVVPTRNGNHRASRRKSRRVSRRKSHRASRRKSCVRPFVNLFESPFLNPFCESFVALRLPSPPDSFLITRRVVL